MNKITLCLIFLLSNLVASKVSNVSIDIYKDKVKQTYYPTSSFIGFNSNIVASGLSGEVKIIKGSCATSKVATCQSVNKMIKLNSKNRSLKKQKIVLEASLNKFNAECMNSKETIAYVENISNRIVDIDNNIKENNYLINKEQEKKVLASQYPYYLKNFKKDKINIEYRGITFNSTYELNIDDKELNQKLNFVNRSGIDVNNTKAKVFERRLAGLTPNRKFTPILIYETGENRHMLQKSKIALSSQMDSNYDFESASSVAPVAIKKSTKTYIIENFSIPSDGIKKEYIVGKQKIKLTKHIQWNAWETKVYEVATVVLGNILESDKINILYNDSITKNIYPRRDAKNLVINIAQEFDIKATKENIPNYSKKEGFFNSNILIENGHRLSIVNLSKTIKKLTVIAKIPVSQNEKITSTLSSVIEVFKNEKIEVIYEFNKENGELKINLELEPHQQKIFEYKYNVIYPKDLKINY